MHYELFIIHFWKIRNFRAATDESEIVTSSDHLKGHNLVNNMESFNLILQMLKVSKK